MASNALDAQKWADFFQFLFIAVQHFNVMWMRRSVQKSHCREQSQHLLLQIIFTDSNLSLLFLKMSYLSEISI